MHLVYKVRPERTGFNMYEEYTQPQLTFLALVPWVYIIPFLITYGIEVESTVRGMQIHFLCHMELGKFFCVHLLDFRNVYYITFGMLKDVNISI